MDKLYNLIKADIAHLAFDEKDRSDYEFSNYVKVSLAESRITRLYQLIGEYYKNKQKNPPKFPFENISDYKNEVDQDKIGRVLNDVEEYLGNDVDKIIEEVNKTNDRNLVLDSKIYVEEITKADIVNQFNGLVKTLEETIKYSDIQEHKFISKKELLESFKSQVSNVLSKGISKNVLDIGSEEYEKIKEYVDNPSKAFMKYNSNIFENEKNKIKFEKYSELSNQEALALENEDEFLDKFDFEKIDSTEELESEIIKSIRDYIKARNDYISNHKENELPSLGRFMFDLKDKITEELPDSELYLGNEKSSNFVKNFLRNPIDGMTKYIDDKIKNYEERDLLKDRLFEDEDTNIDFDKLINNQKRFKDIILRERDNYNDYSKDKMDVWRIRQDTNSKRFENMFKDKMNNVVIPQAIQNNKGGFFENLFGTTSKEYKEFSKSLVKMVEEGPEKGDLDGLRDKTEAYLRHKFKSYDSLLNDKITEEDIARLDSTSQGRVRLCLAVIDSIDYAKKAEYRDLNPYNEKFGIDVFSEITKLNNKFDDLDNFQNNLQKDSEIGNNNVIDNELNVDNNIIENDIKK